MSLDGLLVRWTIRVSLLLYVAVIAQHLSWRAPAMAGCDASRWKVSRWLWTLGCAALWLHIVAAFHFAHHWSHAAAVAETVRQTKTRVGIDFAGGVYFNYVMALVWLGDCLWWWLAPHAYQYRLWWIALLVHGYLFFMVVNGAIVFEAGPTRWVGVLLLMVLAALTSRRFLQSDSAKGLV